MINKNINKSKPSHIIVKPQNTMANRKILKGIREKNLTNNSIDN